MSDEPIVDPIPKRPRGRSKPGNQLHRATLAVVVSIFVLGGLITLFNLPDAPLDEIARTWVAVFTFIPLTIFVHLLRYDADAAEGVLKRSIFWVAVCLISMFLGPCATWMGFGWG